MFIYMENQYRNAYEAFVYKYYGSILLKEFLSLISMSLPASCCARRIFWRLFRQHIEQITMSSNDNNAPKAMPTFAPAERWVPHVGSPGIPQRPALSVKLQTSMVSMHS
jgi:hypothetical protein